jgi:UDP-2,3-diacylglucosamine pyrophosphatase LpxH
MLIVLSDLHFAESNSYNLGDQQYNHNLPSSVYKTYFREIADLIREDSIERIDIVLAGDIFELNRSTFWFKDSLRPYVNNNAVEPGSPLEERIIEIVDAIVADYRVSETLALFRGLSTLFGKPVTLRYISGNHDRLCNASARIRRRIRSYLGMEDSDLAFPNQYVHIVNGEAMVLVRHGHEYDRANFSQNIGILPVIPTFIAKESYDKPVFGDVVTLEIATKIPQAFKEYYSIQTIMEVEALSSIYQRLNDFDNVRPASALMSFLFSTPGLSQKQVWQFIEPVFIKALNDIANDPSMADRLVEFGGLVGFAATILRLVLKTRLWRKGIPFWIAKSLIRPAFAKTDLGPQTKLISREECLQPGNSRVVAIVAGHTHEPVVELLQSDKGQERYYINDGTFRNVITSSPDLTQFGRIRSKARVLIFEPGERNPEYVRPTGWSFDFMAKYGYGSDPDESPPPVVETIPSLK